MRKVYQYSHLGGAQILAVDYPAIDREIDAVIASVAIAKKTKVSRERTMQGRLLYSPKELNTKFTAAFRARGYEDLRDTYTIELPNYDQKIKGAFKQVDFAKGRVLVEVQFGKYAFMFYDLAKFQYFFNERKADVRVSQGQLKIEGAAPNVVN